MVLSSPKRWFSRAPLNHQTAQAELSCRSSREAWNFAHGWLDVSWMFSGFRIVCQHFMIFYEWAWANTALKFPKKIIAAVHLQTMVTSSGIWVWKWFGKQGKPLNSDNVTLLWLSQLRGPYFNDTYIIEMWWNITTIPIVDLCRSSTNADDWHSTMVGRRCPGLDSQSTSWMDVKGNCKTRKPST